jgi:hypothetical protein
MWFILNGMNEINPSARSRNFFFDCSIVLQNDLILVALVQFFVR